MSSTLKLVETPPQEAEQPLLGCILLKGRPALDQSLEILEGGDFYRTAHRAIFNAMVEMRGLNIPIDVVSLYDFLSSQGEELEMVGGSGYLTFLPETVASSEPEFVEYHAQQVKDAANQRRMVEGLIRATQDIREGMSPQGMYSNLGEIVEAATVGDEGGLKPIPLSELSSGDIVEPFSQYRSLPP